LFRQLFVDASDIVQGIYGSPNRRQGLVASEHLKDFTGEALVDPDESATVSDGDVQDRRARRWQ
jgi:hypothetical protein